MEETKAQTRQWSSEWLRQCQTPLPLLPYFALSLPSTAQGPPPGGAPWDQADPGVQGPRDTVKHPLWTNSSKNVFLGEKNQNTI